MQTVFHAVVRTVLQSVLVWWMTDSASCVAVSQGVRTTHPERCPAATRWWNLWMVWSCSTTRLRTSSSPRSVLQTGPGLKFLVKLLACGDAEYCILQCWIPSIAVLSTSYCSSGYCSTEYWVLQYRIPDTVILSAGYSIAKYWVLQNWVSGTVILNTRYSSAEYWVLQ